MVANRPASVIRDPLLFLHVRMGKQPLEWLLLRGLVRVVSAARGRRFCGVSRTTMKAIAFRTISHH